MDDQGHIRQVTEADPLRGNEIALDGGIADELSALSPRARREYYKAIRQGRDGDFAISAALSVDGILIREPPR